jgi:uncharacterized protein (PEP-CTERM system associated)
MLASQYPNSADLDQAVRLLLQSQGLSADAVPVLGYLSDSAVIRRALSISFSLIGVRNTLTFTASRSKSKTETVTSGTDVLATYSGIDQSSLGFNWAYKLSPNSTLTTSLIQMKSDGTAVSGLGTFSNQTKANLLWNAQMGPHVTSSLGLRRVTASGAAAGTGNYREDAVTATFGYKF